MKTLYSFSFMLSMIVLLSNCSKRNEIVLSSAPDQLNWSDNNYKVLKQLIIDNGVHGKFYNSQKLPYVVLDWDQTCAFLDVEEALLHYQLSHLKFKMTKEQFSGLLLNSINGITSVSIDDENQSLAAINQDLITDYNFIFDNYSGLNGTMTSEEIQSTPHYQDFIVKLPLLYAGYCDTPGIGAAYGYPWVLYLLTGYTIEEVKVLAKEAISFELGNRLGKVTIASPSGFTTNAGVLSYTYRTGLRILPEMQNLIATFKENGIEVFIVSASYKPVVEVFSGLKSFGYNVPAENVIAMELATDNAGVILSQYKDGWVKTLRQGKVEAINQVIKTGLGRTWDPLFSAGDSDGDYEMLTAFPDMKLALIWNRVKGGDIGKISKQAVEEMNNPSPRFILQGRNENTGMAIPFSETILFGSTEARLLHE
jgi:phosphoserine phosphatase